jgi:hypothetical protein
MKEAMKKSSESARCRAREVISGLVAKKFDNTRAQPAQGIEPAALATTPFVGHTNLG